jgi:hypothetical protein
MIQYQDPDTKIYTYKVHEFGMGDVEDPDLWAADSLWNWEKTDAGNWVMNNSEPTPSWHRIPNGYGWMYEIRAYFTSEQLMYYRLKFE